MVRIEEDFVALSVTLRSEAEVRVRGSLSQANAWVTERLTMGAGVGHPSWIYEAAVRAVSSALMADGLVTESEQLDEVFAAAEAADLEQTRVDDGETLDFLAMFVEAIDAATP